MESCICCGIVAKGHHPFVGIGRSDLDNNAGEMAKHPVCEQCHNDSAHRTLRPNPKVHFFPAATAPIALGAAKRTDLDSKDGRDLGVTTA